VGKCCCALSALSNAKQRNAAAGFPCLLTAFPLVKKHATYDAVGQAAWKTTKLIRPMLMTVDS
jgi:hypothetical protein